MSKKNVSKKKNLDKIPKIKKELDALWAKKVREHFVII
jgi:hypothetical protein